MNSLMSFLKWCIAGIIFGLLCVGIGYLIYSLIYRKTLHGEKVFKKQKWILLFALSFWFIVMLYLSTFRSEPNFGGQISVDFFRSYLNAWNNWSLEGFKKIFLDMLLFVPFGFLIPLFWEKTNRFTYMALTTLTLAVFVELLQLVTKRGAFQADDIFHNFLGSLFGYYSITGIVFTDKFKRFSVSYLVRVLLIPAGFALALFTAVLIYENAPYGNMPILPEAKTSMEKVEIICELNLSTEESEASILKKSPDSSENIPVAENAIISEEKAFEKIKNGELEKTENFKENDKLYVTKIELDYFCDTKGFYQPVYKFFGYINEKENVWECRVPALKYENFLPMKIGF